MEKIYVNRDIRKMLIELAAGNKTITYGKLNTSSDSGYDFQDPEERELFADDIRDISQNEVNHGRPPLGSVVVYKSGSVTKEILESLFEMCQELYDLNPETTKPTNKFLKEMQLKCHEFWKDTENVRQFGERRR